MDVIKAIQKRRSIREFLDKGIEDKLIVQILAAGHQAPSASNRQEWRFVVVKDRATKESLCRAAKDQKFIKEASVVIACCADTDNHVMTCGQPCYPIDVAIAIDHMTLAAVELGLGTCWIGAFYEEEVKKILDIPKNIKVVELLVLGFPKKEPQTPKKRLPLESVVFLEKWNNPTTFSL